MASYSVREQAPHDPAPRSFSTLDLHPSLARGIADLGFKETRPVQSAVLPYALAGHEVLAQLSGRMRHFRIKVVPGDRVTVGISPYDPQRGIITFRAR